MTLNDMNGVVVSADSTRRTDYLFRVALKAVIINENGEILVVKEEGRDWWDLPGGGLDHGETIQEGLARELKEEVSLEGGFSYEPVEVGEPHILHHIKVTQVRIVFLVKPDNFNFQPGEDADAVTFINPEVFKDSEVETDQRVYASIQSALARLTSA